MQSWRQPIFRTTPPKGAWETKGLDFTRRFQVNGQPNIYWGTVETEDQVMLGELHLTPYKFLGNDPDYDYYAFQGYFRHGVTNYRQNWVSVGYYADFMELDITVRNANGNSSIYEYAPSTTVSNVTRSFQLGFGLEAGGSSDGPSAGASFNAGWGFSITTRDTTVGASSRSNGIKWRIDLPHIGFLSPGNPADPLLPSRSGYDAKLGLIVKVNKGEPAMLLLKPKIQWGYDYTRGIRNHTVTWDQSYFYTYGQDVSDAKGGPTIYENPNFQGQKQTLGPGSYDLGEFGLANDSISSVKVPQGYSVVLFSDGGFQGAKEILTSDIQSLGAMGDKASSIQVFQNKVAEFYEHFNYQGTSQQLPAGRYQMHELGIGNDMISSVKVPTGHRVTLFEHGDFSGERLVLTEDAPSLHSQFNDQTSSIVVEAV
ncbi:MAG: hypothetical protein ETSY1_07555 [Candidatus Entotheonella factor]|uniref:Beta/gamma crystallin 'Greek key' domain-containing protein n=1 Tax=Entotheonella factor TaxID=1429438 RepID=W4LTU5_ENTF1|nr:MAG: hypothetical protein ETSY1_07555 [Candidatus Entotheonella factor]